MEQGRKEQANYEERAALLKALSNPVRLAIMHCLLRTGCRNVGCMMRETGMSQSCVSQHLQKLRLAGLVSAERTGNEVFYRVTSRETARLVAALFEDQEDEYVL